MVSGLVFFIVGYFMFCMLGKSLSSFTCKLKIFSQPNLPTTSTSMVHVFTCFASSTGQTVFNIFHYMYVNGACVYMLCFQYRQTVFNIFHYKYVNCACVYMLCFQDRLSKSPSHSQFKQEIVVFYMCIWDKQQVSIPALPLTFDLLAGGIKIS